MKQVKKKLCALALGLLGVLTMNAQDNLVKNGTFREGNTSRGTTDYWNLSGSGKLESGDGGGEHDFSLLVSDIEKGDYVFQKIENINALNYKFSFAFKQYYKFIEVKLVWSNDEEVVFDCKEFVDNLKANSSNPSDYDQFVWYPKSGYPETKIDITGNIPEGATWVEIQFIAGDPDGTGYPDFYIDDVVFKTSGTPILPDPLEAPRNLKVENVTTQGAKIAWDVVADAEGYIVEINDQTYTVTTNSHDITGLSQGTKYSVEVKGYSNKTEKLDNKTAIIDFFTLSEEKADGENVFFEGGTFKNGDSDLNKGWMNNSAVTTTDANVDGNISTKMKIQNGATAVVVRSYDFSVEAGKKYTVSAMAKASTKEESEGLTFNIVWKKADGSRFPSGGTVTIGKTDGDTWGTIINEVTAPEGAVVAEIQFQLPAGSSHGQALVFYVDDIQVIKGEVAPTAFKVSEKNQRNVTLSWGEIDGKSYKVVVNGKTLEANGNMVRVNGLVPNTEYTAEVYSTSAESKKSSVTFKTNDFAQPEGERIAYLSNIDENGVIPQEFFYNIEELGGDAVKTVEFEYNGLPVEETVPGKISLPATEGKKLVVKITQENGNQTTLTYYVVTFKK